MFACTDDRTVNHSQCGIIQPASQIVTSQFALWYSKICTFVAFEGLELFSDLRVAEDDQEFQTNSKNSQSHHARCYLHHPCRTAAVNNLALKLPVFKPTTFTHSQSPLLSQEILAVSAGQAPCSPTLFICL